MTTSVAPQLGFPTPSRPHAIVRLVPEAAREPLERRFLNVAVALVGLIVTLPLMLALAAAIRLTSRGPALFRQTRIGRDRRAAGRAAGNGRRGVDYGGAPFTMYKFRTMYADAGRTQVWASPDDPRVTPVGRLLRRLRLDELPQLINVLRGDMNVVGPRPEQPDIVLRLCRDIGRYRERHRVRPGITGWAQVNLTYDRTTDDVRRKLACDLEYIRRQSAAEDLRIMLRTVPVMARGESGW
jgi:lipopolysaccharide/colanic/teichoic acid biosynthesis glycosyltransferase